MDITTLKAIDKYLYLIDENGDYSWMAYGNRTDGPSRIVAHGPETYVVFEGNPVHSRWSDEDLHALGINYSRTEVVIYPDGAIVTRKLIVTKDD